MEFIVEGIWKHLCDIWGEKIVDAWANDNLVIHSFMIMIIHDNLDITVKFELLLYS